MKTFTLLVLILMLCSCKQAPKDQSIEIESATTLSNSEVSFKWLMGRWERTNEAEGKATFEFWEQVDETEYSGFGFTLQNGDTIWQERMQLKKDQGIWALHIKAPEDPEPVVFRMTHSDSLGFTCENPEIAFPQKIKYWKSENGIQAAVSDSTTVIPFEFSPWKDQN